MEQKYTKKDFNDFMWTGYNMENLLLKYPAVIVILVLYIVEEQKDTREILEYLQTLINIQVLEVDELHLEIVRVLRGWNKNVPIKVDDPIIYLALLEFFGLEEDN